jgi:hypothetical protein
MLLVEWVLRLVFVAPWHADDQENGNKDDKEYEADTPEHTAEDGGQVDVLFWS